VRNRVLPESALLRRGLPAILAQTFRTMIHSRMVVGMARYHAHYPNADVMLFEPERHEYRLFFSNIFSFRSRREVCEVAYRATRRDLWRRRATLEPIFRRHGFRLRSDVLQDQDRTVWQGVGLGPEGPGAAVTDRLSRALARLEMGTLHRRPRRQMAPAV
jgi:NTE family protein